MTPKRLNNVPVMFYLNGEIVRELEKLVQKRQKASPNRKVSKSEVIRDLILRANDA